ncbi:MAG: hypothetical protein L3J32_11175 [Rhizobiaceae bacterium]|nr:hypothetical protein [Rhizobiaceae bacterium]
MNIYPVIMCGGVGSRLWPTSKASSPKQFVDLLGKKSLFQETALRVSQIDGFARLIVVTGTIHARSVASQLFDLNIQADLLLEPEGRDSAPAIAAASLYISERYEDGIAVVVASDHHIPSTEHFCRDIHAAAIIAAEGGIVTLGIQPNIASSAYGYIEPTDGVKILSL